MKNLLPEQRQNVLKHSYLGRVGVAGLVFVLVIEVIAIVMLLPSYLAAHIQQSAHEQALEEAERQITEGGGDVARAYLESTNTLLGFAEATQHYPSVTELVALLRADGSPGITIEDFSVRVTSPNHVQAYVQGIARTRTALVDYTALLEANPRIAEVVLPLRDLAASQNIVFTITVVFAELP